MAGILTMAQHQKIAQELVNLLTSNDKTSIAIALMQLENCNADITSHQSILDGKNFDPLKLAERITEMDDVEVFQSTIPRNEWGFRFVLRLRKLDAKKECVDYEAWFDLYFWLDPYQAKPLTNQ